MYFKYLNVKEVFYLLGDHGCDTEASCRLEKSGGVVARRMVPDETEEASGGAARTGGGTVTCPHGYPVVCKKRDRLLKKSIIRKTTAGYANKHRAKDIAYRD